MSDALAAHSPVLAGTSARVFPMTSALPALDLSSRLCRLCSALTMAVSAGVALPKARSATGFHQQVTPPSCATAQIFSYRAVTEASDMPAALPVSVLPRLSCGYLPRVTWSSH